MPDRFVPGSAGAAADGAAVPALLLLDPPPARRFRADGRASCARCDAVCCRLTVVLDADEVVPARLTTRTPGGLRVMARDPAGWCVALDRRSMACGIYADRPQACRRFAMDGPYCRAVRAEHACATGLTGLA